MTKVNWNRNYYYTYDFQRSIRNAGTYTYQIYDRLNPGVPLYTGSIAWRSGDTSIVRMAAESYIQSLPGGLKGAQQNESESESESDNFQTDTGIINFGNEGYSYEVTSVLLQNIARRYTWKVYSPSGRKAAKGEEVGPGYYAQPRAIQKAKDWIVRKEQLIKKIREEKEQELAPVMTYDLTPDQQDAFGGTYESVYDDIDGDGIPDEYDKTDDREPFEFGGEYQLLGALGLFLVVTNMLMSD